MKLKLLFYITIFLVGIVNISNAQISGIVYKDFDASGTRNNTATYIEPLVQGVTVKAYSTTDALLATTTTNASGAYSFTGLTLPVRIEFSGLPASYLPGCATDQTAIAGSSVQFISAATTTADFRINNPDNYSQPNPYVVVAKNYVGYASLPNEHSLVGTNFDRATVTSPTYTSAGNIPVDMARQSGVGNTWGVAYSRERRIVYTSAVVRHYFAYGPQGFDAIYGSVKPVTPPPPATPPVPIATNNTSYTFKLSTLGVSMGTDPRNTAMTGTLSSGTLNDHNTYLGAGKAGIGDIDVSADGDTLFAINMLDGAPTLVVINIKDPAAPVLISNNAIPSPGCTNGTFRPWAIKVYEGSVYVGGVCDAGLVGGSAANLTATVYKWNGGTSFTTVVSTALNYARSFSSIRPNQGDTTNCDWRPWHDNFSLSTVLLTSPNLISSPQPILSDIEFTDNGSITLGLMDRFALQTAYNQTGYNLPTNGSNGNSPISAGDILQFCKSGSTFVLEGGAGCTQTHVDMGSTLTTTGNNIPDINEFYFDDFFNPLNTSGNQGHSEAATGSLAVLPGYNRILTGSFDPATATSEATIASTTAPVNTSGIRVLNTTNGNYEKSWTMAAQGETSENRKGGQMGDIEILSDAAPIEIGNRLWNDANSNGIQDPGEPVFPNVSVELFLDANNDCIPDGAALATVITNANGEYIFSNQITTEYPAANSGAKFNISALVSKQHYIVRIAAADWNSTTGQGIADLAGYHLTTPNVVGNGIADWSDNDATITTIAGNQFAQICLTTGIIGENNHTYDFGFKNTIQLCGVVWNDLDGDAPTIGSPEGPTEQVVNGTNAGGGITTGAVLYANLVNAGGTVIATTPIALDGSYCFPLVPANTTGLIVQLTTNQGTVGQPKPATNIPTGWYSTGENKNSQGGTADPGTNSEIPVTTVISNITQQNFGIQQVPESAVNSQVIGLNPGGTVCTPVDPLWFEVSNVGVNPNTQDYNGGSVTNIRLTAFPSNATSITVNSTTYLSTDPIWPANGGAGIIIPYTLGTGPTQTICLDPIDGTVTSVIPFVSRDNAGAEDPTPGSVTLIYTSILPIQLTSFVASPKGSKVEIVWNVAIETSVKNYEILYSTDGSTFNSIGVVLAKNDSKYSFVHSLPRQDLNYYRLKIVDKTGAISYSEVRIVNFSATDAVKIYPVPANTFVNITVTNAMINKAATITILSADGKIVHQQNSNALNQTETININKFASGKYFVRIVSEGEVINKQFEIIR